MPYLLDTNICIHITKRRPPSARERFRQLRPGDVRMSVVFYLGIVYGAHNGGRNTGNLSTIERFASLIRVQPFGALHMQIAVHALALNLTLVSNNTREFSRVPRLKLENWVE